MMPGDNRTDDSRMPDKIKKLKRVQTICQAAGIALIVLGVVAGLMLELVFNR